MRATRLAGLRPSLIRRMSVRCRELHGERALDLAGGIPEGAPPPELVAAAADALAGDWHQYPPPPGPLSLRRAIARSREPLHGHAIDPELEVTVTCGATEAMMAALLAVTDPGDEVVVIEPAYDAYGADCRAAGAVARFVRLRPPSWSLDAGELAAAVGPRTRAVVVNTPHNPTGRVLSEAELAGVARVCRERDLVGIADEVYEHLVYDGAHRSLAAQPGMRERTITISGASKSYSATGWRVGWAVAPPPLTATLRAAHDSMTVGTAHPLQVALTAALELPPAYYAELAAGYRSRRDLLVGGLRELGFEAEAPEGAFYVLAGHPELGAAGDVALAERLVDRAGVATVPISGFHARPESAPPLVRLTFAKRTSTLEAALEALRSAVW
ncbi:MAG TPA: aminotransferase class I/II-fold pyridoxal phosphate-dependent enzyme [Candidatus Dormibacteraeota bacterium]|nr:aminotransferase class I/II-fold pyridoxal phosphate-dependent enzyme [Candidatus Dormibacteraeota bacterium]